MAKIRMIKTEVRTSEKVASWPIEVRYFWILFWGYVDDHGKGKDNPLLIKADCFPLDENITAETIEAWLKLLAEAGVIVRYEVDGARYLAVKNWREHQKPQHPGKDSFPDYHSENATLTQSDATFMQPSCNTHEVLTPELSRVEQSRDMYNEVVQKSVYSDDFETFWTAYPRKQQKGDAFKAWETLRKKKQLPELSVLVDAAKVYGLSQPDSKFQKLPAGWLRAAAWDDQLTVPKRDGVDNPAAFRINGKKPAWKTGEYES
jgi:hypothetical protein